MRIRLTRLAALMAAVALAGCGQATVSAPPAEAPAAATAHAEANTAPLAYIVSQHSPLLDEASRTAISQDFNGVPLNGAATQRQVTAENISCRSLNTPSEAPECVVTYGPGKVIALTGEDATALFAALAAAGVQDDTAMGHITREVTALQCTVDDATAQSTPATGDQVAGFSCTFIPAS